MLHSTAEFHNRTCRPLSAPSGTAASDHSGLDSPEKHPKTAEPERWDGNEELCTLKFKKKKPLQMDKTIFCICHHKFLLQTKGYGDKTKYLAGHDHDLKMKELFQMTNFSRTLI